MKSNPERAADRVLAGTSLASVSSLASVVLMTFALGFPAWATLGEGSASTETDRALMDGALRLLPAQKYTIHEIQTPTGTTVREYVSADGTVFGVAWQGPVMPNLRQVLGSYFDRYTSAAAGQTGRRHAEVRTPDFVIQSNGHMRSFSGRAYLPPIVPQGVALEEIK